MPSEHDLPAALEPALTRALRDHLRKTRDWDPDAHRPRGRDIVDRTGIRRLAPLPETDRGMRRMLVALALAEHDLPSWHRALCAAFGREGVWGTWIGRWTAEQGRHAVVLREHLIGTGVVDPGEFEAARLARADGAVRWPAADAGVLPALVYATLAHGLLRTVYLRLAARSGQQGTERMLRRLAGDENLHLIVFGDVTAAAFDLAPAAAAAAAAEVIAGFRVPHAELPGARREAAVFAIHGGYDPVLHRDEVLRPALRRWRALDRGLGAGEQALRDALADQDAAARRFAARRAAGPLAAAG